MQIIPKFHSNPSWLTKTNIIIIPRQNATDQGKRTTAQSEPSIPVSEASKLQLRLCEI